MGAELALFADSLVRSTPLIIAGLAVALAFRGGVFNIGAEGQLLVGAIAATTVSLAGSDVLGRFIVVSRSFQQHLRELYGRELQPSFGEDFMCWRSSAQSC